MQYTYLSQVNDINVLLDMKKPLSCSSLLKKKNKGEKKSIMVLIEPEEPAISHSELQEMVVTQKSSI